MNSRESSARLFAACLFCLPALFVAASLISPLVAQEAAPAVSFDHYYALLDSGDLDAVLAEGRTLFAFLVDASPDDPVLKSVATRLKTIRDSRARLVAKLHLIRRGVSSGNMSPFAFVVPTKEELYSRVSTNFYSARLRTGRLDPDVQRFVTSCIDSSLKAADRDCLDAFAALMAASASPEVAIESREYLSSYLLGAHDEEALRDLLPLLSDKLADGNVPSFLFEDAVSGLADFALASRVADLLDEIKWAQWPPAERLRLFQLMASGAHDAGQFDWAARAYAKVVEKAPPETAEETQYKIIALYHERAKTLKASYMRPAERTQYATANKNAAEACVKYLELFPDGPRALTVEQLIVNYSFFAEDYKGALKYAATFVEKHSDSPLVPSIMLVEGLATSAMQDADGAIEIFLDILKKYPKSSAAGSAAYSAAYAYMSTQRYAEAKELFQKVVDFYPGHNNVEDAKKKLKTLAALPEASAK